MNPIIIHVLCLLVIVSIYIIVYCSNLKSVNIKTWIVLLSLVIIGLAILPVCTRGLTNIEYDGYGNYLDGVVGSSLGAVTMMVVLYQNKKQNEFYQKQQFTDSLFRLIDSQKSLIDKIIYRDNDQNVAKGLDALLYAYGVLCDSIRQYCLDNGIFKLSAKQYVKVSNWYFGQVHKCCIGIDSYFRHLYHIIDYIDQQKFLTSAEKQEYVDLIQSNMFYEEIMFVFDSAISPYGNKKAFPLYVKYNFFKHYDNHIQISKSIVLADAEPEMYDKVSDIIERSLIHLDAIRQIVEEQKRKII